MKVLLLGLGRANMAVAKYLIQNGHEIFLYEDNIAMLTEPAQELIKRGEVKVYHDNAYDLVIASPGFRPDTEIVAKLRTKNVPVIDEVEFTYTQLKNPKIIAVTGTNGKSTTVALISNILSTAGITNFLGGNIAPGTPFSQVLFMKEFEYYVLEISSFQLMRIKSFHPKVAVITNISTDHLNWHQGFDEYKTAKSRIFFNQDKNDFAVLNFEDEQVRSMARGIKAKVIFFGSEARNGVWLNSDFYYDHEKLFAIQNLPIKGRHNLMNIAAGIAVTKILKIPNEKIEQGVRAFKSLPHRLEDIGLIQGVRYINNSMCTNESAAIASFEAIEGEKIVIVGGKQKGDRGQNYLDLLTKKAKACVILGENAQDIAAYFKSKGYSRFQIAQDIDDAIKKAKNFAEPGAIVLLNPGFASFDYFKNFEDRGEAFKNAAFRN